jgi:predicted metal-dependent enzyme (double-stranded beta helix superfamily)
MVAVGASGAQVFRLADFIDACRAAVERESGPAEVLTLMHGAVAECGDLAAALAERDPDEALFCSDAFTVFAVTLQPGEISVPHDHRMWAVIGVYEGAERNSFFHRSPSGLAAAGVRVVQAGDAVLLGDDVIHAIEHAGDGPLRALHVYGGDLMTAERSMWHPETGEERPLEFSLFEEWNEELRLRRR